MCCKSNIKLYFERMVIVFYLLPSSSVLSLEKTAVRMTLDEKLLWREQRNEVANGTNSFWACRKAGGEGS